MGHRDDSKCRCTAETKNGYSSAAAPSNLRSDGPFGVDGASSARRARRKDVVHHARRQLAGVGVLPAGVVAADERLAVGQRVRDGVAEGRPRPQRDAASLQQLQVGVEADLARARRRRARAAARRSRRRDAAGSCAISSGVGLLSGGAQRTAAAMKTSRSCDPSSTRWRGRDIGEAGAVQRRHQKVAGAADAVAGEDPAGAVGAVRRRRETDEQQARAADRRIQEPACPSRPRRDTRGVFVRAISAQ